MKLKPYIIFIATTALLAGCQQNEDYDNRQVENYLDVSIQGVTSSNWGMKTRAAASNDVSADTLWLNDSIYVEAVAEDIVAEKAPTTRATPITNAKQIETLSIMMFNTRSSGWSSSSSQESGKSPILARNTNGSYIIDMPYTWLEEDPNYRTLIAISPQHTTDGFVLSTNGQSLDVTVQSDVAKQYDLCVSDISLNKNILYTIGSNSNQQQFEMAHVMTAVGFEAAGYDLMLTGVKFTGVNSKNTLTLHNRTWGSSPSIPALFEAKINASQWLNSEHIQTSNPWRNITPNDGYMMMLPQSHTDDMKLEFTFTGQGGQPAGTYTMQLNKIIANGATTSEWKPGVKITYRLRLKTRPAVQVNNITLADHMEGSTTPALSIITSTDDDLTFSWTASWLGMYRGTNTTITNPESNGYFTPFTTGVNNWANVKFFARNNHNSIYADRTATITVSGKKSGVRTFTVTQPKEELLVNLSYIPTSILKKTDWRQDRLPAKGLEIAVRGNKMPGSRPEATDPVIRWATRMDNVPTWPNVSAGTTNAKNMLLFRVTAAEYCAQMGSEWYVPSTGEWGVIWSNKHILANDYQFVDNFYWSSTQYNHQIALIFHPYYGIESVGIKTTTAYIRCVRNI